MTEADAPQRAWAVIIIVAVGLKVINTCDAQKTSTAARNTRVAPKRWASFAPSMTKPATSIEYATIPVATVVGGTPKLFTMPPIATGNEATLNDMIDCPKAMAIIGTHDACGSDSAPAAEIACTVMSLLQAWWTDGDASAQ
jgi:hypothetical protein